jgi:hypothetical protein
MENISSYNKTILSRGFMFFLGMIILGTGLVLDTQFPSDWFQRSGAVLVAFVVYVFLVNANVGNQIAGNIVESDKRLKNVQQGLKDFSLENLQSHGSKGALEKYSDSVRIEEQFVENVSEIEKYTKERTFTRKKFLQTKGLFLIVGTLVWGFGDLFTNRYLNCGEWTCCS